MKSAIETNYLHTMSQYLEKMSLSLSDIQRRVNEKHSEHGYLKDNFSRHNDIMKMRRKDYKKAKHDIILMEMSQYEGMEFVD